MPKVKEFVCTRWKQKYGEEKTTAKLKDNKPRSRLIPIIPNNSHLPNPPYFSLYTTFKSAGGPGVTHSKL
jgi:hypothetical protein